jgi:hypothetical protein
MGGGSGALLKIRRTPLVQILIQTQFDTVGERTDALPSAPGELAI